MSSEAETQAPPPAAAAAPLPAAVVAAAPLSPTTAAPATAAPASAAAAVPDAKPSNGSGSSGGGGGGGGGGNGTNGGLGSAAPPAGGDKKVIGEERRGEGGRKDDGRGEGEGVVGVGGRGLLVVLRTRAFLPPLHLHRSSPFSLSADWLRRLRLPVPPPLPLRRVLRRLRVFSRFVSFLRPAWLSPSKALLPQARVRTCVVGCRKTAGGGRASGRGRGRRDRTEDVRSARARSRPFVRLGLGKGGASWPFWGADGLLYEHLWFTIN